MAFQVSHNGAFIIKIHNNAVCSLSAQTVLCGVVTPRMVVLITRCHNSKQHSLSL